MARTGEYALVVLDLMLPGLNGYKVCAQLRREGNATPILILTAKDGEWDQAEALDTGADDYLVKPFSYLVLVARLRALVRRAGTVVPPVLAVGDLSLDVAGRVCRRAGVRVDLTPREFAVLELLARRAGQAVSKSDLLYHAWPDEAEDPNLVEARVSALRKKVDAAFHRQSLQTVRGTGYRLVDDRDRDRAATPLVAAFGTGPHRPGRRLDRRSRPGRHRLVGAPGGLPREHGHRPRTCRAEPRRSRRSAEGRFRSRSPERSAVRGRRDRPAHRCRLRRRHAGLRPPRPPCAARPTGLWPDG
ncbi:hypothetical protein SVIOM342S_04210 [Streptomyces violaceorubidus]